MRVAIKVPIWNGNKVGIRKSILLNGGTIEVEVLYTDKNGNRIFPHLYKMECDKARWYPTHKGDGRIPDLVHIPIDAFDAEPLVPEVVAPLTPDEQEKKKYMEMMGFKQ